MKARFLTPYRTGLLIAVASGVLFGLWPTAVRGIYANGGNFTFALLAMTWARALTMTVFCLIKRRSLFKTRAHIQQGIVGGFFQAVAMITIYIALLFIPGPIAIIIIFSHTLMLLFYMAWRGEIRLDRLTVATTVAALGGLSVVLDLWHTQSSGNLWGIALSFVAALATVSRLYVYGHQTQERHPIVVGAENFLAAGVLLLPMAFVWAPQMPTSTAGWGYVLLGCFALATATFGMFYGISLLGSFRWSLFLKLEPIFTSLFAAWFLNEFLQPHQYVGIAIVVGSLALYQIVDHRRKMAGINPSVAPIQ